MSSILTPLLGEENEKSLGEARKYWIVEDIEFAIREADHWFVGLCGECVVKIYPLYVLVVYPMSLCIVGGLFLHRVIGQGGPVRTDEKRIERETRAQWIYGMDGPFAVSALINLARLIMLRANQRLERAVQTDILLVGLLLDSSYVLGNIVFLDAMRRKDRLVVRVAIVANAVFGIGFVFLFIYGIVFAAAHGHLALDKIVDWILRCLVVGFFLAAASKYSALWHVYNDDEDAEQKKSSYDAVATPDQSNDESSCFFDDIWHILVVSAAAIVVWILFLLITVWQGPHAVWAAVA